MLIDLLIYERTQKTYENNLFELKNLKMSVEFILKKKKHNHFLEANNTNNIQYVCNIDGLTTFI